MLQKLITVSILSIGLATSAMAQSSGVGGGAGGVGGSTGGVGGASGGGGLIGSGSSGGIGTGTGAGTGNTLLPNANGIDNTNTNSTVPNPDMTNPAVRGPSGTGNGMGRGTPDCNGMTGTGASAGLPGSDSSAQVRPNCQ